MPAKWWRCNRGKNRASQDGFAFVRGANNKWGVAHGRMAVTTRDENGGGSPPPTAMHAAIGSGTICRGPTQGSRGKSGAGPGMRPAAMPPPQRAWANPVGATCRARTFRRAAQCSFNPPGVKRLAYPGNPSPLKAGSGRARGARRQRSQAAAQKCSPCEWIRLRRRPPYPMPNAFQIASTRCLTSGLISMTSGQGRVKPSSGHLRVASTPIFEP